jgi:hypothetical protein
MYNTQNNQFNNQFDDEISLQDIFSFFKRNFNWILISTMGLSILAYTIAISLDPIFESELRIEMAKVANTVVEDPKILISKLKSPTYYSVDTLNSCISKEEMQNTDYRNSLPKSLDPKLDKDAPIVSLKYKALSNAKTEGCLLSVLKDIKSKQNELAAVIFKQKKYQLETLQAKLALAEKYKNQFGSKINYDFNDNKFSATSLLTALVVGKDSEIKDLQNNINDLQIQLAEPQTRETYLSVPIISNQKPVFPKKSLFEAIGFLIGGMLSTLFFIFKESLQKAD